MADNNEEQYLDELLNSLMNSNTGNADSEDIEKKEETEETEEIEEMGDMPEESPDTETLAEPEPENVEMDGENEMFPDDILTLTEDNELQTEDPLNEEPVGEPEDMMQHSSDEGAGMEEEIPGMPEQSEDTDGVIMDNGNEEAVFMQDEPNEDTFAIEEKGAQDEQQTTYFDDAQLSQDDINKLMDGIFDNNDPDEGIDAKEPQMDDIFALEEAGGEAENSNGTADEALIMEDVEAPELHALDQEFEDQNPVSETEDAAPETSVNNDEIDEGLLDLLGEMNQGNGEPSGEEGKKSKKDKKEKKEKKKKSRKKKSKEAAENPAEEEASQTDAASKENVDLINALYSDTEAADTASETGNEDEEEEAPKKEKKKKEKKVKPPKAPKPPKPPKPKKEKKAPKPSELVKVTPFSFLAIILFTAIFVTAVLLCSNILTYSNNIASAQSFFDKGKYDQAYDCISGLDVKEKDQKLYYQIRAVMSIYVDYSSYISYAKTGYMVEALDSLIQGLVHYDMYYSRAEKYEVLEQYNEVRALIVASLAGYGISEEDAVYFSQIENREQYIEILQNIGGIEE